MGSVIPFRRPDNRGMQWSLGDDGKMVVTLSTDAVHGPNAPGVVDAIADDMRHMGFSTRHDKVLIRHRRTGSQLVWQAQLEDASQVGAVRIYLEELARSYRGDDDGEARP